MNSSMLAGERRAWFAFQSGQVHALLPSRRNLPLSPPPPGNSLLHIFFFRLNDRLEKMLSLRQLIASGGRVFWGWFFLIIGSFSFLGFLYAVVISKLQPPSDNTIIQAIQNDWYYCFLVPLTLPILTVAVYFHWLSMKLFKHA